jgi:ADP-heptose:LPS heptosyltransferase
MRTVDALNPFKRAQPFHWRTPVVVSSAAGLGDLFIHLPLLGGIVNTCRERGLEITVALRPDHLEIGRRLGWDVFPFDNGLEDFFKNPAAMHVFEFAGPTRKLREKRPALWIDLTGNAVSAIAIKIRGAKRLAARITRGGKSLVDHPLPHFIQENEYENRLRVASHLGCALDFSLSEKMNRSSPAGLCESIVLCLTTASRWKNWPLANFRRLIERFPESQFTVIGFAREILPEDLPELDRIVHLPNVVNRVNQLTTIEMVDLIVKCRAVVTNDTSAAHIANFFGKPGAVLFGPVSPHTFATPEGLRVFHDATCPYHPCVQWRCSNKANWCMRKISASEVADYLETLLGRPDTMENVGLTTHPAHDPAQQPDWQRKAQLPV